jgi:predicted DNA-binding transcriptional regulator AlpA
MSQATATPDLQQELESIKSMLAALLRNQSPVATSQEVCELLRIARNTLTTYKKRPDFPTPTRGKFDRAEIVEWATKNQRRQRH